MEGFFNVIFYVGLAMLIAWVYKVVTNLWGIVFYSLLKVLFLRHHKNDPYIFDTDHPRLLISLGIINHVTIGSVYAFIIAVITFYFLANYNVSYGLYSFLAICWSFTIVSGMQSHFRKILLWSCVGGVLALLAFPSSPLFFVYEIVVLAVGIAYYFGKIDLIQEEIFHE